MESFGRVPLIASDPTGFRKEAWCSTGAWMTQTFPSLERVCAAFMLPALYDLYTQEPVARGLSRIRLDCSHSRAPYFVTRHGDP